MHLICSILLLGLNKITAYETARACLPPSCPQNVQYQTNLDLERLQGAWYVNLLSQNGSTLGCDGDCWTLYLARAETLALTVNLCCEKKGQAFCGAEVGSGLFADSPIRPGALTYTNDGVSRQAFVLETDYDNYLIGYLCILQPDGSAFNSIYAYYRSPTLSKKLIKRTKEVLERNGIDPSVAVEIPQGRNCNYTFGCRNCVKA